MIPRRRLRRAKPGRSSPQHRRHCGDHRPGRAQHGVRLCDLFPHPGRRRFDQPAACHASDAVDHHRPELAVPRGAFGTAHCPRHGDRRLGLRRDRRTIASPAAPRRVRYNRVRTSPHPSPSSSREGFGRTPRQIIGRPRFGPRGKAASSAAISASVSVRSPAPALSSAWSRRLALGIARTDGRCVRKARATCRAVALRSPRDTRQHAAAGRTRVGKITGAERAVGDHRHTVLFAPRNDRVLDRTFLQMIEHLITGNLSGPAIFNAASNPRSSKLETPQDRILPSSTNCSNAPMVSASG